MEPYSQIELCEEYLSKGGIFLLASVHISLVVLMQNTLLVISKRVQIVSKASLCALGSDFQEIFHFESTKYYFLTRHNFL